MKVIKKKSIGLNAFFNVLNTSSSILFPLISYGHVTRTLGIENIGKYNFSFTFVTYFQLIAALGISTYAVREGAKYRNDKCKLNKFASQMLFINICATVFAYILLFSFSFINKIRPYSQIIFILSLSIILVTLGCEWVFSIYEDYVYIAVRSIIFKCVSLALVLLFVNEKQDLALYTWIMLLSGYGSNIINVILVKKYVSFGRIKINEIRRHLKPVLQIFINSAAVSIYVSSDTTILGIFSDDYYVGLYSVAGKVYSIVKTMIAAVIIVTVPRLSLYINQDKKKFYQLANTIFNVLLCIMMPTMAGLFVLSPNIILVLGGKEYLGATTSLRILCIAMLISVIGWFFSSAILIPAKKEREVLIATLIAAATNIILNIILIPVYYEKAAAFTTLIAELVSMLICIYYSKKVVLIRSSYRDIFGMIIGSILIFIVCKIISLMFSGATVILLAIVGSAIVYFLTLRLLKCRVLKQIRNVF